LEVSGQLHALSVLSPGVKNSGILQERRLGGHRIRQDMERRKFLPILGLEILPLGRINNAKFITCKVFYEQSA
jgi:hypothetical protein